MSWYLVKTAFYAFDVLFSLEENILLNDLPFCFLFSQAENMCSRHIVSRKVAVRYRSCHSYCKLWNMIFLKISHKFGIKDSILTGGILEYT